MAQENQYQDAKGAPVDRSTDTHRVVAIDPDNPIHQSIIGNPQGSNINQFPSGFVDSVQYFS